LDFLGSTGELRRLLEIRVPERLEYQNAAYAREYAEFVKRVAAAERAAGVGETRLSEAMARYLFKLMAYLHRETYDHAVTLAGLPDLIRGYEQIKLRNVERFREGARSLGF